MNKVGIHYAYWLHNWNTDFIESIRHAKEVGFDAVDFATADMMALPKQKQLDIRHCAEDLGISLAFAPATGDDVDIACADPAIRSNGIEYFKRCIDFVADMGSDILAGIIYSAWSAKVDGVLNDKHDAFLRSQESLTKILPTAEARNVRYCLEIVNRFEQYLLNSVDEGISFVDALGSPNACLLLDTFHMNIEEDDIPGAIRKAGHRIAHFHVGEPNRRLPGQGKDARMGWSEIFRALNDVGYTGTITMEPFVRMGGEIGKAVSLWRDLVNADNAALDLQAKEAITFVKEQIAISAR